MQLMSSLKNMRRRAVESVFQTVGLSETTTDEEFDKMHGNIKDILKDMNECGAAMTSVLKAQKMMFGEAQGLTSVIDALYTRCEKEKDIWPSEVNKLKNPNVARVWNEKWDHLNDVTRSSVAIVCCDEALDPVKDLIKTFPTNFDQEVSDRNIVLKDFDAYRRRIKNAEAKKANLGADSSLESVAALDAEINKARMKMESAGKEYDRLNNKIKEEMKTSKEAHDTLIETLLITFITAQVHLLTRAAKELDEVLRYFPAAQVRDIKDRIETYENKGGVMANLKEKSTITKVYEVAVGKATPADNFKSFSNNVEEPTQAKTQVISLFAYRAASNDELSFDKGVTIDVLDDTDSGWWKGRVGGKEGIFPSNYVSPISTGSSGAKDSYSLQSNVNSPVSSKSAPTSPSVVKSTTATSVLKQASTITPNVNTSVTTSAPSVKPPRPLTPTSSQVSTPPPTSNTNPAKFPPATRTNTIQPRPNYSPSTTSTLASSSTSSSTAATSSLPKAVPPQKPNPPLASKKTVTTIFAYEAADTDELSFPAGAVIEVLDNSDPGWWKGKLGAKQGLFPSNYVKK